jgi:hypothetical protein
VQLNHRIVGRTGRSTVSLRPHCQPSARCEIPRTAFSPRDDNRSTIVAQSFGASRAALTPFARHRHPVPENRPRARVRCLTRRRGQRLRCVVCMSCASKPCDLRERILPIGGRRVQWLRLRGSAACIERIWLRAPAGSTHRCEQRHRKQLLPRRRPTHGSTRQDAGFRARRPSRLVLRKTDGVTPLAARSCRTIL